MTTVFIYGYVVKRTGTPWLLEAARDPIQEEQARIGHIAIQWIPGYHPEIPGNEEADGLARVGANVPSEGRSFSMPNWNAAKTMLRRSMRLKHAAFVHQFEHTAIPKPGPQQKDLVQEGPNSPASLEPTTEHLLALPQSVSQLHHICIKSTRRLGSPLCTCGSTRTAQHLLFQCPSPYSLSVWNLGIPITSQALSGSPFGFP